MADTVVLNRELVKKRLRNLSAAARSIGIRPATLSDLCTGKAKIENAQVKTLVRLADLMGCRTDDLLIRESAPRESFAESMQRWSRSGTSTRVIKGAQVENPVPRDERIAFLKSLPDTEIDPFTPPRKRPNPV